VILSAFDFGLRNEGNACLFNDRSLVCIDWDAAASLFKPCAIQDGGDLREPTPPLGGGGVPVVGLGRGLGQVKRANLGTGCEQALAAFHKPQCINECINRFLPMRLNTA
jgi:hypothetical protein